MNDDGAAPATVAAPAVGGRAEQMEPAPEGVDVVGQNGTVTAWPDNVLAVSATACGRPAWESGSPSERTSSWPVAWHR